MGVKVKKSSISTFARYVPRLTRQVTTTLVNKEEVFRMLALAEATGLPILLIGDPGVAKTKSVLEFVKSWLFQNIDRNDPTQLLKATTDFEDKTFILETDEDTSAAEVKGRVNMEKLVMDNLFEILAPITEAEVVIINEIDKAGNQLKNALLGVMNEKFLFNGKKKTPCKWKWFVATCNEIPRSEMGKPFWDRFVIKLQVSRVAQSELVKYFQLGDRKFQTQVPIGIPTRDELDAITIPIHKLEKYLKVAYDHCSDRTLTYTTILAKAIAYIYGVSINDALVKVCSIMVNNTVAGELKDQLISDTMKQLLAKADMIRTSKTQKELEQKVADIGQFIQRNAASNSITEEEVNEITVMVNEIVGSHKLEEYSILDSETVESEVLEFSE